MNIENNFSINKNESDNPMILLVTGVLGSGKTTFLVNLLNWLSENNLDLPPVIVNDRGEYSNLDYERVNKVSGVNAIDLHGQCIGCEGQADFIKIIQETRSKYILVEPTGLFSLEELHEISESVSAEFRAIHLLPANKLESAIVGTENLSSQFLKVIGLTHSNLTMNTQTQLLESSVSKPVIQFSQSISNDSIGMIWNILNDCDLEESSKSKENHHEHSHHSHDHHHECSHHSHDHHHECSHHSHDHHHECSHHSHDHHHGCSHHSHGHHHEGEPYSKTFFTEGQNFSKILAYLLSLGENLVRFKGVLTNYKGEKVRVDWAHGTWTQRTESSSTPFKADLFTKEPVEEVNFQLLTDQAIDQLSNGIPPVYTVIHDKEYDLLEPVGSTAWGLLYEQSQDASPSVKKAAGSNLVKRCIQSLDYIQSPRLNPNLINFYKMQIAMLWTWWNHDFDLEINDREKLLIEELISEINPDLVDNDSLSEWIWDGGPDFKVSLKKYFPLISKEILNLFD